MKKKLVMLVFGTTLLLFPSNAFAGTNKYLANPLVWQIVEETGISIDSMDQKEQKLVNQAIKNILKSDLNDLEKQEQVRDLLQDMVEMKEQNDLIAKVITPEVLMQMEKKEIEKRNKLKIKEKLSDNPFEGGTSTQPQFTASHVIDWSVWSYGDIILGSSPSISSWNSVPYGTYRHAATYDSGYGNFISAMPDIGVYRESKSFWSSGYSKLTGIWVPDSTYTQRVNVVNLLRAQMGEPYYWSSPKWSYDSWYCSKLPWRGYLDKAGINIEGLISWQNLVDKYNYWVFPDELYNDWDTSVFMSFG